ncbi:MAG: hypothetical protein K0S16_2090, partial [Moraxellaceae bacterium]|nr:hypothetical protein [Moraxellaceae bacterium]
MEFGKAGRRGELGQRGLLRGPLLQPVQGGGDGPVGGGALVEGGDVSRNAHAR